MMNTSNLLSQTISHLKNLVVLGSEVGLTISEHYGTPILLLESQVSSPNAVYYCMITLNKNDAWQQYQNEILTDLFEEHSLNVESELLEVLLEQGARNLVVQISDSDDSNCCEIELNECMYEILL